MPNCVLEVKNVSKRYQMKKKLWQKKEFLYALKEVHLQINHGESFGIVGESGSGKSTLAHLLMGIKKADVGQVLYKNKDLTSFPRIERKELCKKLQIVFQDPYSSLNPKHTIEWTLTEPLKIHQIGTKEFQKQKVIDILNEVGLDSSYLRKKPHELSGGQRQRIAIASALILDPEIVVIDEGVSALDVSIQAAILNLLNELKMKRHLTYVFISHDLNVVKYFCDRIAVLYHGELIETFRPEDYQYHTQADYTKKLFDAIPSIPTAQ